MAHYIAGAPVHKRSYRRPLQVAGALAGGILLIFLLAIGIQLFANSNQASPTPVATGSVLAIITNSGSTNTPGFTLTINKDGSGAITYTGQPGTFKHEDNRTFSAGTFQTQQLSTILNKIHDVSTIPSHGCLKSISFGTVTTISYNGKTSSDLSCLSKQDGQLMVDLKTLIQRMYASVNAIAPGRNVDRPFL